MATRLRTLVFLAAALPVAAIGLAVLIAGWVLVACLAITPLVVPALVAFRVATGGASWVDAWLANGLLGTSVATPVTSPGPRGFWRSGWNVLGDSAFWRQQAYLLFRLSIGFGLGVAALSGLAAGFGLLSMPIWYRWTNAEIVAVWHIDTLGRALLCSVAGAVLLGFIYLILGPLGRGSRAVVTSLLGRHELRIESPEMIRRMRRRGLELHAIGYATLNAFLIAIWALSTSSSFWPVWTLIALGLPLGAHAVAEYVESRSWPVPQTLALHTGLAGVLTVFFTSIWAASGGGYFWPVWVILALGITIAIHAVVVLPRRSQERIAELEETRAGAVEQQESELARIERDLHDGAQARLVALGMQIGLAEQKLATDPAAAQALLAEARHGTREALEELRDLARGIHPPVLADRGLEAAIAALAVRTPLKVDVKVDLPRRPPQTVETAAYFVVAESLANSGKHSEAGRVEIVVREREGELVVEVSDDGVGGADENGSGLRGLARRVGALDGRLEVVSPAGGPTTIRAVMPCGS
jgi:signal transduction histidine kinase